MFREKKSQPHVRLIISLKHPFIAPERYSMFGILMWYVLPHDDG